MTETLYHPEVYLPACNPPSGHVKVLWSRHARTASRSDRYGEIPIAASIDLTDFQLVELARSDGVDTKYVMRGTLDTERDVIYVLRPVFKANGERAFLIVTVWINLKSDSHRTLNRGRYARA